MYLYIANIQETKGKEKERKKKKQEKVDVATNDLPFLELIVIIAPRATIPFFPIHSYEMSSRVLHRSL